MYVLLCFKCNDKLFFVLFKLLVALEVFILNMKKSDADVDFGYNILA